MNKEQFFDQWLTALRSGEYRQGRAALKSGDNFCCLGVACDVLAKRGEGRWMNPEDESSIFVHHGFGSSYGTNQDCAVLPQTVSRMLDISESGAFNVPNPLNGFADEHWLTVLNDEGFTFAQIADVIEYFHAPRGVGVCEECGYAVYVCTCD